MPCNRLFTLLFTGFVLATPFAARVFAQTPPVTPAGTKETGKTHDAALAPVFRVYTIRYSTAIDLQTIVGKLIPAITIVLGPQPAYLQHVAAGAPLGDKELATGPSMPDKYIADEFVRTLILSGPASEVDRAMDLLKQIDTPAPQTLIETRVVEVQKGISTALGVTWDFAPSGTTAKFTESTPKSKGHLDEVLFGRLSRGPIDFTATLDAALQHNRAKLLANPRLLVLYNHRAQIFIGDEVTYLAGSQTAVNGATLQTDKVRVGVELNVVAAAHPDGTITLRLHPEVGQLLQLTTLSNGVSVPQVSRRYVDTEVRVKDGETLVIGGLIGDDQTRTERKIPLLGDLPLLGYLFRHETRSSNRTEVLIFLKATIQKE